LYLQSELVSCILLFAQQFKSWKEAEWEEDKKEINNQAIDVQGMVSNKIESACLHASIVVR
jgi:hypothetical protein